MRAAVALLLLASACSDAPAAGDAGPGDAAVDGGPLVTLPACEETEADGVIPLEPVPSTLVGTIVPDVPRMEPAMSLNPAQERGELRYRELGLHRFSRGPGRPHLLRTDLGGTEPTGAGRRSIAYFVHLSDLQLADDESPLRIANVDTAGIPGGLRAQEAYLPRAVSAMNRTLTRIEPADRGYDFGIITGDCADSAQENELRWVIDLMNGAPGLHTDSADDDDPLPGPDNDPKDPFDPVPFPAPWLYVAGNHDVEVTGITTPDEDLRAAALGVEPRGGTRDYRRWYGAITTLAVPADPARRIVDRQDIVDILLADTAAPGPAGHGYAPGADATLGASFVHDAIPGLLRVVNLDTNDDTGGANGLVHRAAVDGFLRPALDAAEAAGLLVVLASHHSTLSIDVFRGQLGAEVVPDAVPPAELEALVAGYPNVIAWLVGHAHTNFVRAIPGPDAEHPGYWEIMTSAMADFPSQARILELVDNADGTLSIYATLIDFDAESCMERRFRRLAIMEWSSGWWDPVSLRAQDGNVHLLRPTPPSAAAAIAAAPPGPRIESLTSLRGG